MVVPELGNQRGLELDMFWGEIGACLDTEVIRVLGTTRGMGGEGGVKEMQVATQETKRQPKDGRQTIAREIGSSKTGRGRQPKQRALSVVCP